MDGAEFRWRPPSVLLALFIVCGCLLVLTDIFQLHSYDIVILPAPQPLLSKPQVENHQGFLIKTSGCRIPDLDPFDPSIIEFIEKPSEIVCKNGTPPLVESTDSSLFVMKDSLSAYSISDVNLFYCCYIIFTRRDAKENESDNKINYSKDCTPFLNETVVEHEFVEVKCYYNDSVMYKDYFSFVPYKKTKEDNVINNENSRKPLNVLIIGMDGVSRLNMHRQLPKTIKTLNEFSSVEFLGYNKVADNTFPNLIPVLTGLSTAELRNVCWPNNSVHFDSCPFVWKNYSQEGFTTGFGEDSAWMGIFNYVMNGFHSQPTDYYWTIFNREAEAEIGNAHVMNIKDCVASRPVYLTFIEYMKKFVNSMTKQQKPFFGFFWEVSISHDFLNKPKLADDHYSNLFKRFKDQGILNNTAVIFMSDHGIRWGGIRWTYQGRMEERLPSLFVLLPKWYRDEFPQLNGNLKKNRRRLTTPFDLHETIKDLLSPYKLTAEHLNQRLNASHKRGYSLFEYIPENRTCYDADISAHWCTCQETREVNITDPVVVEAAEFTISYINAQLIGYKSCATLTLDKIVTAQLHAPGEHILTESNYTMDYTLALMTKPGDGIFESTVRQEFISKNRSVFNLMGTVSRLNLYGKQSSCITDYHLKLYCYCNDI